MYPDFRIKSVDLTEIVDYIDTNNYKKLIDFLVKNIKNLQNAGVDFGAIASNTPHFVYEKLMDRVNLGMISIV